MRETIPTGERGGMTAKLIGLLLVAVVAMILIQSFTQNIAVGEIESSGARSMKALNKGLITYATMWGGYPKSLKDLVTDKYKLVDPGLAEGESGAYRFTYTPAVLPGRENERIVGQYTIVARPKDANLRVRSFFTNERVTIRWATAGVEPNKGSTPY
jgi:hypothetical protein